MLNYTNIILLKSITLLVASSAGGTLSFPVNYSPGLRLKN